MKMYSLSPTIKSHMAYTCAEGKKVEHEKNICKRLKIIKRNERKRFLKFLKFYGYFNSDNNTDKKKKITIWIYELFTRTKKKKKEKFEETN